MSASKMADQIPDKSTGWFFASHQTQSIEEEHIFQIANDDKNAVH